MICQLAKSAYTENETQPIDFPRLPLTADVTLFRSLCALGQQLVGLHLLESPQVGRVITRYSVPGDNMVER